LGILSLRKYISSVLLLVFVWATIPTHTLHEYFADHHDNEHGACSSADGFTTFETKHQHCEILDYTSPVYDSNGLTFLQPAEEILFISLQSDISSIDLSSYKGSLLSRGPPALS